MLGRYYGQFFNGISYFGMYWSSTSVPKNNTVDAYYISFNGVHISFDAAVRLSGFVAQPFSYFGDN